MRSGLDEPNCHERPGGGSGSRTGGDVHDSVVGIAAAPLTGAAAARTFDQDLGALADPGPVGRLGQPELKRLQPLEARLGQRGIDGPRLACRGGARSGRVLEGEAVREPDLLDQRQGLLEIRVRFPWEPHDQVGGDRQVGSRGSQSRDESKVVFPAITPPHAIEHAVRAALDRQVDVRTQARKFRVGPDQRFVKKEGVGARVSDPRQTPNLGETAQEPCKGNEVGRGLRSLCSGTAIDRPTAIGVHRLSEQRDLANPGGRQGLDLGHDRRRRPTDLAASSPRHDAEAAE